MARTGSEARPHPLRPRSKAAEIEDRVRKALSRREMLTRDVETEYEEKIGLGERVADMVAEFGGSWKFIILFSGVMAVWMVVNSFLLRAGAFDPYPYILLNLILSTLAAVQAPIIMMSQNRQAAKDRARSDHQYEINLKSEISLGELSRLVEELSEQRIRELAENQRRQIEYLEKLLGERA
jgi:uncharacterized membrane protein